MLQLIGADICRDGGSIAVEYRKEDAALVSVLLEVAEFTDGEPRRFQHLHVSSVIRNGCDASTIVRKNSEEERSLLRDVDELLQGDHPNARGELRLHLNELKDQLAERLG